MTRCSLVSCHLLPYPSFRDFLFSLNYCLFLIHLPQWTLYMAAFPGALESSKGWQVHPGETYTKFGTLDKLPKIRLHTEFFFFSFFFFKGGSVTRTMEFGLLHSFDCLRFFSLSHPPLRGLCRYLVFTFLLSLPAGTQRGYAPCLFSSRIFFDCLHTF